MKKLLKPVDVFHLGLAGLLEIFEEIRDPVGIMAGHLKAVYGFVPGRYKRHNFRQMVWRQLKTGDIEKVVKDGKIYLRLTNQGREKVKRDFPLLSLQQRRWDKKWRVVIFDIKETKRSTRDALRLKLRELGFGMLQRSSWITPYDISLDFREFIKAHGLEERVYILEVSQLLAGDERELVEKIWKLEDLDYRYEELYRKLQSPELKELTKTHERYKLLNKFEALQREFLQTSLQDPFLPKELLPEDWLREKVEKEIRRLAKVFKREFKE